MDQYAGIDVTLEASQVCVVEEQGRILKGAKVSSEPEALIAWFAGLDAPAPFDRHRQPRGPGSPDPAEWPQCRARSYPGR